MKVLFFNCSLKGGEETSNTEALYHKVAEIMREKKPDLEFENVRVADYRIPLGIMDKVDDSDAWPVLLNKIQEADIFLIGTPIWQGIRGTLAHIVGERLYGSGATNDKGQMIGYNKVAGVIVTGNEDGGKHAGRDIQFELNQAGFTIPPSALTYWVGDAGPGPSFIEAEGWSNEFTRSTSREMAYNLVHLANIFSHQPIPAEGNVSE
ncbi:flavodoxin family protein [Metabacillus sp. GX 13764]|uniref:flavodoxin family protein n=1 Tax=Metabacillus kandeliae TaxID=2900151 RepID=UPI001E454675|nr:flavodoxin family protein [Metabacillus kandeliae]MCD7033562.1 flavodoxin family protein [Metabacillus kandeliae]